MGICLDLGVESETPDDFWSMASSSETCPIHKYLLGGTAEEKKTQGKMDEEACFHMHFSRFVTELSAGLTFLKFTWG